MDEREHKLAHENVKKLLVQFSTPAIISMLVNALYNIVDRIYIGKIEGVGQYALTGVGLTMPISTVILAFAMLMGIGSAAIISIRLGQKRREEAEKTLANDLTLSVIIAVVLTIAGLLSVDKLLYLFGASQNTFVHARDYINIIIIGTIFNFVGFSMNHPIRAEGNPKRAAYTMFLGAILNTILDPVFIFVFGWGVQGAAIATILSQLASAIWVLSYFIKGKSLLRLKVKYFKLEWNIIKGILSIGMSPFVIQLAASLVSIVANNSLKKYGGDLAIGAMTVIGSVTMIFLMPVFGINQGSQPIIGYNYGAGLYKRVKSAVKYASIGATFFAAAGFLAVELFPAQIIMLFNDDPSLVNAGIDGIRIYLSMLPIVGFQIVSTAYFQSVGKAKISMFLSLLRQVILLIPMYLILPNFFGLLGVWLAGPISDAASAVITSVFIIRDIRKESRVMSTI